MTNKTEIKEGLEDYAWLDEGIIIERQENNKVKMEYTEKLEFDGKYYICTQYWIGINDSIDEGTWLPVKEGDIYEVEG